ncbi:methyltransferase domain-containing protein [Pseudodesulfovibrio sp. zrk46]|uniref:class I SAM-dependent methyltransferase n=1 Tax=Pseudodesulfovibrio sp. zrk46 TaxID=2725288 RepID=UPI001448E9F8|nr:methyltransferase domain-containing protein [Pseudodesulfovibrio sp. zrk46]QJB58048.1 class I SAM-dependent methyltransferase [Pseudodesulfovibrio sp. zrk46]
MAIKHTKEQYLSAYPDGIEFHYWHSSRNRILCDQLKKINFSGVGLDIGCGRGMDVQKFRDAGFNYYGVEISNPTPYYPQTADYLNLNQSSLELPEEFRKDVSLISFLDVLPHMEDPYTFVKQHRAKFPNLKYILAWIVGRQELYSNYDKYVGAFRRYSLKDCYELFPGGQPVTLQYCFHLLYLPALMLSLCKQDRNTDIQAPDKNNQFMMRAHKLVSDYLVMEAKWFPKKIFGSSIVCLMEV